MSVKEKLERLLLQQREILKQYEALSEDTDFNKLIDENNKLKQQLNDCHGTIEVMKKTNGEICEENKKVKTALKEQILDEKLNILKIYKDKLDIYFKKECNSSMNKLLFAEAKLKEELLRLKAISGKELGEDEREIANDIEKLSRHIQEKIKGRKEKLKESASEIIKERNKEFDKMADEEISDEVIQRRIKNNNIENKIGTSLINKIGILLIIIGASTALKYTYSNYFTNEMKGIFVLLIGILFLGAGEWFNRHGKNTFALGLIGGAIGVLYIFIFHSYFNLEIMDINTALLVSVLVTTISILLSIRYDSKVILGFSLIGGFFPFFTYVFAFDISGISIYAAMGYLFILNLLTLLISFRKKWTGINQLSFLLNLPALMYLVFNVDYVFAGIVYAALTFVMYLIIPLAYSFKYKVNINAGDVILVALNTISNCIIIYCLFEKANLSQMRGAIALLFCCTYFALGKFMEKRLSDEKSVKYLFYLTSYTFAILIAPFQLGIKWFAMGWLVEGVLMILYGYKKKIKFMEIGGWVILGLCTFSVLCVDYYRYELITDKESVPHFHFRYLCLMAGLVFTLFLYLVDMGKDKMMKYSKRGIYITWFKYFTIFNFWIYVIYNINYLYQKQLVDKSLIESYFENYYRTILLCLASIIVSYIISMLPLLYDEVVSKFSAFLVLFSDAIIFILNFSKPVFNKEYGDTRYLAIAILLAFNVLAFLNFKNWLFAYIKEKKINFEDYPLAISVYLLANVTIILLVQFDLEYVNLVFSLLYIVSAFCFIIFGFKKKYIVIRRFGLGLSIFSIAKLFIYDLAFLETSGRIASYFSFGIVLIAISYLYQRYSKALEQ